MRDVRTSPIVKTALVIAVAVGCVVAAVLALMHWRGLSPGGARVQAGFDMKLDAPGLYSAPQGDTAMARSDKEKWLHSSGWVDEKAGIAHIPIEEAMDRLVAQGGKR
jgi:hypothetical protein